MVQKGKDMTDLELVDGCVNKDPKAQRELYNRFASKMLGVSYRYANSQEEAQDVLQDAFIKVFERISSFKKDGSLEGWIRRVVVNTSLDNIRKTKKEKYNVSLAEAEYLASDKDFIIESMSAKELLQLLKTLPLGYRTVFNLYAIEGYSHKEIADQLDISENTSKSQFSRAKAFMRKLIEQYELD
ncbi:MAG: RNA polymerase sigma factor (sigma-70 family) [Parvicellaceae bacterium]|jgi:RNA polymerase sigma factor (sigma-70 family)